MPFSITINPAAPALPTWRVGMSVGQWLQVPGTSPGAAGMGLSVSFWNGMQMDRRDDTIYFMATGGHNDSSDNGCYSITMSQNSPTWQVRRAASGSVSAESDYYPDGRPTSAHTYSHQQFIQQRNRAMRFGAGSRYGPTGTQGYRVDGFNTATNDYDSAGTYPNAPNHSGFAVAWTSCQDYSTGNVYLNYLASSNRAAARWDQSSNTWTTLSQPPWNFYGYYMPSAFDHTRGRYLILGGGESSGRALYTVATDTWTTAGSISGTTSNGERGGMEYVEAIDAYVIRSNVSGGGVTVVNASTFATQSFSTTGGGSIPNVDDYGNGNGVFNKWQYSPNLGGIFYIGNRNANIWFLRLH